MEFPEVVATEAVHERVRQRYAAVASFLLGAIGRDFQSPDEGATTPRRSPPGPPMLESGVSFGWSHYPATERMGLPTVTVAASLGCGNPIARAPLAPGRRILDLGCGGGIDVLLAAAQVGDAGHVVGLDLTFEMLSIAARSVEEGVVRNVSLVQAAIERLPLADRVFDVVLSNSVVHFSANKGQVAAEAYRVLAEGGALVLLDLVAEDHVDPAEQRTRAGETGWTTGALGRTAYAQLLSATGFVDVKVELLHRVADGMHAGLATGRKPDEFK